MRVGGQRRMLVPPSAIPNTQASKVPGGDRMLRSDIEVIKTLNKNSPVARIAMWLPPYGRKWVIGRTLYTYLFLLSFVPYFLPVDMQPKWYHDGLTPEEIREAQDAGQQQLPRRRHQTVRLALPGGAAADGVRPSRHARQLLPRSRRRQRGVILRFGASRKGRRCFSLFVHFFLALGLLCTGGSWTRTLSQCTWVLSVVWSCQKRGPSVRMDVVSQGATALLPEALGATRSCTSPRRTPEELHHGRRAPPFYGRFAWVFGARRPASAGARRAARRAPSRSPNATT